MATYAQPEIFRPAIFLVDVGHDPLQAATMRRARLTGRPVASPPLHEQPPARGSFILYVPTYDGLGVPAARAARDMSAVGYAVGAFRFVDVTQALRNAVPAGTGISITTHGETVVQVGDIGSDPERRRLEFAGQVWDVKVAPVHTGGIGLGFVALLLGLVVTILLTLLTRKGVRAETAARELATLRERERDLAQEARVLSEADSRSARERFRRAFEDAPVGMALSDGDGQVLDVNQALADLLGREHDELVGTSALTYVHPDDAPIMRERAAGLLEGHTVRGSWEARFVHADGHELWVAVHASALGDAALGDDLFLTQLLDITDRTASSSSCSTSPTTTR